MEDSIIGEGELTIHEISKVIEKSTSCAVLLRRWRMFANYLGVNDADLPGLQLRINLGTLQLEETPREVLQIWKAGKGPSATLRTLCEALVECGLNDIADALKTKFSQTSNRKFILNDKPQSLEELFENNVPEEILQIVRTHGQGYSSAEPLRIIIKELCPRDLPEFYIPRTLLYRNQLDEKVFQDNSTKEHVFLVKGAKQSVLARACGFKPIERSGNQLKNVTVQHILLECDEDFDEICRNTTKPIHIIEFKHNSFFHLKSTKGFGVIKAFIKENGTSFDEDKVVLEITRNNSPCLLRIADSPGMGKSFVLAKFFSQIQKNHPKVIKLFIVLQELANNLRASERKSAIEIISTYAASNYLAKSIFQGLLSSHKYRLFLFLDGYDEVMQDKLDLVDSLLNQLAGLPLIKIIITTRVHIANRLENMSQKSSYEILPFSESNQIDFLTKYWSDKHGAENGERLRSFAQKCLQALKQNMTSTETDIAGVPLQCSMIAEVYAEQARRAAKLKAMPDEVVKITSFFEMYKSLVELKFKRIGNSLELRKKYIDAHVHDSIALLFPHWLERFKPSLNPRKDVEESLMYSIGLIEKSPSSNTPRFVHRTFAENFLAQFIVWNIEKEVACVDFLYTEVLGKLGIKKDDWSGLRTMEDLYELRHPVIAYFINMHLQDHLKGNDNILKPALFIPLLSYVPASVSDFIRSHILRAHDLQYIREKDLCIAANACCSNGLENCFDLTKVVLKTISIKRKVALQKKYFKDLPHLVVERTENVSLLKKVLDFTKMELEVSLNWHVSKRNYGFSMDLFIPDCTPLHVAVCKGKYNMVIHLLEEYGQDVLPIKHLMHCCLRESFRNTESIIEDKVSIIDSLNKINPDWLEEDLHGEKPIVQNGAHVKLIKYLVQLGADINTYNEYSGTILHTGGDRNTYTDLVCWTLRNGFTLINHVDCNGSSPLMKAIERFRILENDVLRLLVDAGADVNAQDEYGNSVLHLAIQWFQSVDFVKHVLDLGANPTHTNNRCENAAHVIMNWIKDPSLVLDFLKLLEPKGFTALLEKNNKGATPVHLAIRDGVSDNELLKYLVGAGPDEDGNSALFYAIQYAKDGNQTKKILSIDENVNHRNKKGENAAHIVIQYQFKNQQLVLELLKLLESNGFTGLHETDNEGITPINLAIWREITDDELLKYLVSAGEDRNGNSAFFYALMYANENLAKKLLSIGENVNHRIKKGANAAHFVIICHHKNPQLALQLLKLLELHGFQGFNEKNINGRAPFELAQYFQVKDMELLKFLNGRQ